jgi:putative peptidoglycan lipid II flippase
VPGKSPGRYARDRFLLTQIAVAGRRAQGDATSFLTRYDPYLSVSACAGPPCATTRPVLGSQGASVRGLRTSFHASSLVVFVGVCLSMLIGIVFQGYLAAHLGIGPKADVFYLGTAVPTLIATALLGSASNALMRSAVDASTLLDVRKPGSVPRRLAKVALLFSASMAVFAGVLWLANPPIFAPHLRHGVAEFVLLTTPVPLLALLAAIGAVRALAKRKFVVGTWGGAVNGVGLLLAAVALSPLGFDPPVLAAAVVFGYVLQVAFVGPSLLDTKDLTGSLGHSLIASQTAKRATSAFLILCGASAVYKSQPLVERGVGAVVGSGVPAALGYADKITTGLIQLATFGFSIAALPLLSRDLSEKRQSHAVARLETALAATCVSTGAVVSFALVSSHDLVSVFYERGAFGAHSASITNTLILCALPSVAFGALAGPLVSLGYAAGRIRYIAGIGLCGFFAGTIATIVLAATVGYQGIVLGTAVGYAMNFAIFTLRARTFVEEWSWRAFWKSRRSMLLTAAATAVLVGVVSHEVLVSDTAGKLENLFLLSIRLALALVASFSVLAFFGRRRRAQASAGNSDGPQSVVWLALGGRSVASSRIRAFRVSDALEATGIESRCVVASGLAGRLRALLAIYRSTKPTVVVVQKILFGSVMLRLLRKKAEVLVWECDDALHVGLPGENGRELPRTNRLIAEALKTADVVTTSNPLLASDFRPASGRVVEFQGPAPPRAESLAPRERVVVWLGSPSTVRYLSMLGDAPRRLQARGWQCVAVGAPDQSAELGWHGVAWSLAAQDEWLGKAVVGVMPQTSDVWSDRKQGYKLF